MNLRLKHLPWLTLGTGGLGAVLYLLVFSTSVDERGLLPKAHPLLFFFSFLVAAVMVLIFLEIRRTMDIPTYGKLFPASELSFPGCIAGSGAIIAGIILTCKQPITVISLLAVISGGLAAVSLLFVGWARKQQLRPHYIFHSIISIYLILQLIAQYQRWNTQPQLIAYFPQLIALVFLMLCGYYRATLDAGIGKSRVFAFLNLNALLFCCMAVASSQWPFFLGMAIWCFTNQCHLEQANCNPMGLPDEVLYCIDSLEAEGYSAYAVGGCVRDHLLDLNPSDYDLCTSATPEQICAVFSRHSLVRNGEKHGTIGVVLAGKLYEITTFRAEGSYSDARHPDWVEFVTDINQDLARRDFTINAMAYSPNTGFVDPYNGQHDLATRTLRTVGDPQTRFREDVLRILRGVRFAVRYGLTPVEATLEAMDKCAPLMDQLAKERISSELCKLLPLICAKDLLRYQAVITQIIPELTSAENQTMYAQTAKVVGHVPKELPVRMAALLHALGTDAASEILSGLKCSNALRDRALLLVQLCADPLPTDKKQLQQLLGEHGREAVTQLLDLQMAIAKATGQDMTPLENVELLLGMIYQGDCCLNVKDLAITGSDLLELGVEPGPHIGKCMQYLLSLVQDEVLGNTKNELLAAAKAFFEP